MKCIKCVKEKAVTTVTTHTTFHLCAGCMRNFNAQMEEEMERMVKKDPTLATNNSDVMEILMEEHNNELLEAVVSAMELDKEDDDEV